MIAIAFGTINVVGGFLVTDRMLEMFRKQAGAEEGGRRGAGGVTSLAFSLQDPDFIQACYIVAFSLFIYGMHLLNHPSTARRGNMVAAVGMAIAVAATLLIEEVGDYGLIALGIAIGTAVGVPAARNVKMTAMPQMVALFNGVGGGAVALIAWAEFREAGGDLITEEAIPLVFAAIVGSISFWGSNIAFGKLQEIIPGRPIQLPGPEVHQRRCCWRSRWRAPVAIVAGSDLRGPVHPACSSRRRSWATCSCCRSAAPTCRW